MYVMCMFAYTYDACMCASISATCVSGPVWHIDIYKYVCSIYILHV